MISVYQASRIAKEEKKGFVINNAVKYKEYYVFFMQPKGVDPNSEDALLDSYVFVNSKTGKVEYRSIYYFSDFFERSIKVKI